MNNSDPENMSFDKDDLFARKIVAENILALFRKGSDISPLAIDGGWGTGKTTFIEKMCDLCNAPSQDDRKMKMIYVNAFQADHTDDPFMMILSAIITSLPKKARPSVIRKVIENSGPIVKNVLKGITFRLLESQTGIDLNSVEGISTIGKNNEDLLLEQYFDSFNDLTALQKTLSSAVSENNNNKLIIAIDELDRCRPDFAVRVLEAVKHIFDINGLYFIFVANLEQIKKSLIHRYGDLVSVDEYLDKFINYSIELCPTKTDLGTYHKDEILSSSAETNGERYLREYLIERNSEETKKFLMNYINAICVLIKINRVSLRSVEKIVRYLEILIMKNNQGMSLNDDAPLWTMKILAVFVYALKPKIVKDIEEGRIDKDYFVSSLEMIQLNTKSADSNLSIVYRGIAGEFDNLNREDGSLRPIEAFFRCAPFPNRDIPSKVVISTMIDTFAELRYLHDIPADLDSDVVLQ